jgi:hypothetical protein
MSIFNNSDLNYNYDGNGVNINNFEDPDYSITEKIEVRNCRGCNKEFEVRVAYDKNGSVVFFVSKYCNECNIKMKINNNVCVSSNDATWGTVSIDIANVPQNRVEGLQESLSNLSLNIKLGEEKLNALEKDHEGFAILQTEINFKTLKEIKQIRDDIKFFNNSQADLNEKFADHIKKLIKESIIMFSMIILLFVIDLAVLWLYIRR